MMRGIVTVPNIEFSGPKAMRTIGVQDPQTIRTWSLYWDRIAAIDQRFIGFDAQGDLDFLEKAGVFARYRMAKRSGEMATLISEGRLDLFERLEAENPGAWAIASGPGLWDGIETTDQRSLRIRLTSALPIPDKSVPLDEILAFRERRKDECESLMIHIDKVYQSVVDAPDRPLAEHTAMAELAKGVRDQLDAVQDSGFLYRLGDIAADFNLASAAAAATTSLIIGASWPLVAGNSLIAGASISIGKIFGLVRPKKTDTPYRYVTSYKNEVFGPA